MKQRDAPRPPRYVRRQLSIGLLAVATAILAGCAGGDADAPLEQPQPGPVDAYPSPAPSNTGAPVTGDSLPVPPAETPAPVPGTAASEASPAPVETPSPEPALPQGLGSDLHDFTLPAALGGEFTLSDYIGQKNVVLVFYRAWW